MNYKFFQMKTGECVQRLLDNAFIPFDPANTDYLQLCLDVTLMIAEVQDDTGNLLTNEAVRDRLIANQPLKFSRVVGTREVDTVIVEVGAALDLTLLGASQDVIVFKGAWSDYKKTVKGTTILFKRLTPFGVEAVSVSAGTNAMNDKLTFTEGAVGSYQARMALTANPAVGITEVSGYVEN